MHEQRVCRVIETKCMTFDFVLLQPLVGFVLKVELTRIDGCRLERVKRCSTVWQTNMHAKYWRQWKIPCSWQIFQTKLYQAYWLDLIWILTRKTFHHFFESKYFGANWYAVKICSIRIGKIIWWILLLPNHCV